MREKIMLQFKREKAHISGNMLLTLCGYYNRPFLNLYVHFIRTKRLDIKKAVKFWAYLVPVRAVRKRQQGALGSPIFSPNRFRC